MIFRAAGAEDVPVLHGLLQALAEHGGGGDVASIDNLTRHGFGARTLYWAVLAEDGDRPLGMAIYFPEYSTHRGQVGLYVQDLYVTDAARGLGVGRGLLRAAIAAQDWGAAFISLGVSPDNAGALAFYRRQGFRDRGYDMMILDGTGLEALQ